MEFFALHDRELERLVEVYTSLEAAQRELETILGEDPDWAGHLEIVRVDVTKAGPVGARRRGR